MRCTQPLFTAFFRSITKKANIALVYPLGLVDAQVLRAQDWDATGLDVVARLALCEVPWPFDGTARQAGIN